MRRQYLASATGDLDLWRTAVAADVEWIEAAGFPLADTYDFRSWLRIKTGAWHRARGRQVDVQGYPSA
ncbi:hypothetical protein ATE80_12065 [Streptomyces kanasensis]|uniref:Uncharacterized protein n=1 Tax=Streptomyces kanasensis TaxID=936756 RepID=A0A117IWS0_9ACTN|nr:hypothetical protein ATE80_12065 [Streptomyces kanasensis]